MKRWNEAVLRRLQGLTSGQKYNIKLLDSRVRRPFYAIKICGKQSTNKPLQDVCILAIKNSELLYGVAVSPRAHQDQAALDEYLRYVQVFAYTNECALHYAQIRAALKRSGTLIGANDLFIAAHARSLGLVLVTNNVREFGRVAGLQIENWTEDTRSS